MGESGKYTGMNDYARVARIIELIDKTHPEQPSLKDLAGHLGLSEWHFHRLFSKWAGVTPKAFLRCLTHHHARELLTQGSSVLDASLDVGLSGPGRLHDLCVDLEAATPGEIKSGGEGWTIHYGFAESPFGEVILGENDRGICHLVFVDRGEAEAESVLQSEWPQAQLRRDDCLAGKQVDRIFNSSGAKGEKKSIKAFVRGTPMQVKVWRALLQIPAGCLTSYGEIAADIHQPKAARAVGSAIGSNPLAYLIPCHRVIRKTGVISGYRWGSDRKRMMIAREAALS